MARTPRFSSGLRALCAWALLFPLACGGASAPPPRAAGSPAAVGTAGRGGPVTPQPPGAPSEEDVAVPIAATNPTWGSRTAPVTIVEFADLQCPFCTRAEATLASVREAYGPESVRLVWKNNPLPFHANARPAAEAAAGVFALAGNDAFWKFHDAALRDQHGLSPAAYERWATEAGVADLGAFRSGLEGHAWAASIDKDVDVAKDLGAVGTPTFFVNGLPLAGALPFPTFQVLIDEQLRLAQAKVAAGTPPERLYAEIVKDNRAKLAEKARDDAEEEEHGASTTVYKVPVGKSPVRGSPAALVTMVEFADYECPFCVRVEPTIKALRDEYGDKLRVVFKDMPLPFHPRAEPAAEAALEVRAEKGDAAFWAMHDGLLGAEQGRADLSDGALAQRAAAAGANADGVKKAIAGHTHRTSIEDDADVADDVDANGTPHFFINGRRLVGAQPKEQFEAVIAKEMARAQALVVAGTKPEDVYEELTRDGKAAIEPEKKALPAALAASSARAPGRGAATPKVLVHEWSDFQCPFCSRVEPTLARLVQEYGAQIRVVWHDLPLPMHPDAPLAARAAREVLSQKGERAFWTMHDQLFSHQTALARSDLDGYARGLGVDMGKWTRALDGNTHADEVEADKATAGAIDIDGTPAFLVVPRGTTAGYFVTGAQPYPKFRKLVERALTEAK